MRHFLWAAALAALLLLTGCGDSPEVGEVFDGEVNGYEGVTLTVVEGTAMPGCVTVEVLNTTEKDIESGNESAYGLQTEQDGQWYWLERKRNYANTAEAYGFPTDTPCELTFIWGDNYGSLKPGNYRVVKNFFEYRGPGDFTDFLLAAEFTLE